MALRTTYRLRVCEGCGEIDLYGVDCTNPNCSNYGGRLAQAVVELVLVNGRKPVTAIQPHPEVVSPSKQALRDQKSDLELVQRRGSLSAEGSEALARMCRRSIDYLIGCSHAEIHTARRLAQMTHDAGHTPGYLGG